MQALTAGQRQYVRRLAHDIQPMVHVGKQGITEHVLINVDQALSANELIKLKFMGGHEDKQAAAQEIATATKSHLIGVIGNILILYRQQADPERRQITLPR